MLTQGPLTYRRSFAERNQFLVFQPGGDRNTTAIVFKEDDARLYAAAPDLLDALVTILSEVDQALDEGGVSALSLTSKEIADAAIRKARGL